MPGFQKNLDPKLHKLEAILGRYAFPDKIACGLSNCHQPHGKGYLVKTVDGALTNIGKDCGATHFDVDFQSLSATFERDLKQTQQRERLNSVNLQIDNILARVENLRKGTKGADWIHAMIQRLKSPRDIPESILHALNMMVKRRTNQLVKERMATKTESDAMAASGRRPPYIVDEVVAEISGMEALHPENDLRQLLIIEVQEPLRELDKLDVGSMTANDLRNWVKVVDGIEPAFQRAEQAMEAGQKLLKAENLKAFLLVELHAYEDPAHSFEKPSFARYLKLLE